MVRDDLRDPAVLRLYDYWRAKAGTRFAPARADIDPVDFAFALADVALIDVLGAEPLAWRYRVVGGNLAARDGYDLTGKTLADLPHPEYRERVRASWGQVAASRQPAHVIRETVFDGRKRRYESLILPLSADGAEVDMLLAIQRHLGR